MIPIRDNIPSRTFPFVNYAMIAACMLAFGAQLSNRGGSGLVEQYGMIPQRVLRPDKPVEVPQLRSVRTSRGTEIRPSTRLAEPSAVHPWLTLLTCIFLHGGWMHFLGNMWFLYIFGDNVEDRFGHLGYVIFYLVCGVGASAAHLLTNSSSPVPTIGASGAIAGVMGAYFVLYPRAKVLTVVPIFFFLEMIVLPAPLFLGVWFAIQFFQGAFAITAMQSTGVAWWAHIGGFVVGLVLALKLRQSHKLKPAVERVLPHTSRTTAYRIGKRRGGGW